MSRSWNGESLVDELSAFLGDTSTPFKTRVLGWLNDVIFDISTRHDWGFHLVRGRKILSAEEADQSLEVEAPGAPTVELTTGGNLSENSIYKVLVTYVQANGVESVAGTESEALTMTSSEKSITLTDIPTSNETIITKRNVYLKKDDGAFFFYESIDDNHTISLTIDENTDSVIEPPDYESVRLLKGSPFFEEGPSVRLTYRDEDQLRMLIQGQWTPGNPEFFSPVSGNSIVVYPPPSEEMEVVFNYYRYPHKLYYDEASQPDLPINLKTALKAGVIWYGYEYRERDGAEVKKANYENAIRDAIDRGARRANIEYVVKDVYGNFDGFEVG